MLVSSFKQGIRGSVSLSISSADVLFFLLLSIVDSGRKDRFVVFFVFDMLVSSLKLRELEVRPHFLSHLLIYLMYYFANCSALVVQEEKVGL